LVFFWIIAIFEEVRVIDLRVPFVIDWKKEERNKDYVVFVITSIICGKDSSFLIYIQVFGKSSSSIGVLSISPKTPKGNMHLNFPSVLVAGLVATIARAQIACNGNVALCDRKFSNVSLVGDHDSAFVGTYVTDNQGESVTDQLDKGVRFLQAQAHSFLGMSIPTLS